MEDNLAQKWLLESVGSVGIDDIISTSHSDTRFLHDDIVQTVPVEILSTIFGFVEEAIFAPKEREKYRDVVFPQAQDCQPSQSPPLLVGAVCKRWRDITLTTPQLWRNLIIDLLKSSDGQLEMINTWAARSSHQPLDITIFLKPRNCEPTPPDQFRTIFSALRSFAGRWNDVALNIPESFRQLLLNNLEDDPPINSLYLPIFYNGANDWLPIQIQLQSPLRPRRLVSFISPGVKIRCEWDRLVFLDIEIVDFGEILHIIRHAQNLTHCIAGETNDFDLGHSPVTEALDPIVNRSLIYLRTRGCHIIRHLTLPSLIHLDYTAPKADEYSHMADFINRSRAPLDDFILRCYLDPIHLHSMPPFDRLPDLTSLKLHFDILCLPNTEPPDVAATLADNFMNALTQLIADPAILPRLEKLLLTIPCLSESAWASFGRIFPKHAQEEETPTDSDDSMPLLPLPHNTTPLGTVTPVRTRRRSLPRISVWLISDAKVMMDKETFLRLSAARESGVDLSIMDYRRGDILRAMAQLYDDVQVAS